MNIVPSIRFNLVLNGEGNLILSPVEPLKYEFVTYDDNELFRRFGPEAFMLVMPPALEVRDQIPETQMLLENMCDNGINAHGRHYKPAIAGAGKLREGEFFAVDTDIIEDVLSFCGLDILTEKIGPATKISKYYSLPMSISKSFEFAFPDGEIKEPRVEHVIILDDVLTEIFAKFLSVTPAKVEKGPESTVIKNSDGTAYYVYNDIMRKPPKSLEGFTFRTNWQKGCVHVILLSTLFKLIKIIGDKLIDHDAFGRPLSREQLLTADLITFKSVVKCSKALESWEDYTTRFHRFNCRFSVCVKAHNHVVDLPYQQFQTLDFRGHMEDIDQLVYEAAGSMLNDRLPYSFGNKAIRQCLKLYPPLFRVPYVWKSCQISYSSRRRRIAGGRIPKAAVAPFCQCDPLYVLSCALSGGKVKLHAIPKNHIACDSFWQGDVVDVTRCPHLDNAHEVRQVIDVPEEWKGFFLGHTVFISAFDELMVACQADFDGDHLYITSHPIIIDAAIRSHRSYDDKVLLYAAVEDVQQKKGCVNYLDEINERFKASNPAPIGPYAIALVRLWANPRFWSWFLLKYAGVTFFEAVAFLTRSANTCIDEAGGHGQDVKGKAEFILDLMNSPNKKLPKRPRKPQFHRYAKASVDTEGNIVEYAKDVFGKKLLDKKRPVDLYQSISVSSHVDVYSQGVLAMLPQSFAEAAGQFIDWKSIPEFDFRMLTSNPGIDYPYPGMTIPGLYKADYKDLGIYNQLAKTAAKNVARSYDPTRNFFDEVAVQVCDAVKEYAEEHGRTLNDAVDYLAFMLFGRKHPKDSVRFNAIEKEQEFFFIAFGDIIIENLQRNTGNILPQEPDMGEDDYDIDNEEEYCDED